MKNTNCMKIQFQPRSFNLDTSLRQLLEQPLHQLQSLIPITSVLVVLEQQRDNAPAFRAFVSLAIPGPDIHAEARDHTLAAVWLKVTTALRQQIEGRKTRQQLRRRGRRQHPLTTSRWSGVTVASRICAPVVN